MHRGNPHAAQSWCVMRVRKTQKLRASPRSRERRGGFPEDRGRSPDLDHFKSEVGGGATPCAEIVARIGGVGGIVNIPYPGIIKRPQFDQPV